MQKFLNPELANNYKSNSQKIRIMSENWVLNQIFCANCAKKLFEFENNRPVADFYCADCKEEYELKSKSGLLGKKVSAGAYSSMIERINSPNNPHFFFMNYAKIDFQILNFMVVPNYFVISNIIEKREPLSESARRAGWVGCNILLSEIPQSGKIFYIKDKQVIPKQQVLDTWQKTLFLRKSQKAEAKGWILSIMNCIDAMNKREFSLSDIYKFEKILSKKHPNNKHIKDKIRQQLQILRDNGYLEFIGRGKYRLTWNLEEL